MTIHDSRPNPDELLAAVSNDAARQQRGALKIFFGMSAGVGKTYAMLEEARKRASEGVDVLVGYAEPHIRPDTEAVLVALDILPYRIVNYRDTVLKEFDLDAALARKPAICCVDELAHTNAPGLRHPKRWQDVAELLDAGISVYSTLNVQHLESVNDLVERITGVQVRETLPDAVFDAADEVELVDIAPEELLERFREGRVYKLEQAERASRHFFTKGNLIALRELALRKTADRVDEQMQQHRRDQRLSRIVPASEKVLVCVGPSPLSARVIRSARRLSTSLRSKFVAVSVELPGAVARAGSDGTRLTANLRLAEELGAEVTTLSGQNVAAEVLAHAATHNVTKIVVGKSDQPRWKELIFGSVVDELLRRSGEIDIYVIRGEADTSDETHTKDTGAASPAHDWTGYALAIAVVGLVTAIGWPLYHRFGVENENILMLYLLCVLWIATQRSRGAAILTSVLAVMAFDLSFVEPIGRLAVRDRQYVVTFLVMLLTAFVISVLTYRVRAQGEAARKRERLTSALLGLSRDLAAARTATQIAAATQQHVSDAAGRPSVLLMADRDGKLVAVHPNADTTFDQKEMGVAQWAFEHDQPAGHGTTTLPVASRTYVPLRGPRGPVGILGVLNSGEKDHWSGEHRQLIEASAAQAAMAVERANLVEEARLAWERVESEFVRNTLLSGVSHELRTPLAGITGAATTLAAAGNAISDEARREMLDTIVSESERMERLINNLLDMSRMESGGLTLKREWIPIEEVIGAALRHLDHRLRGRPVKVDVPGDLPLTHVDETAIEQVLANLIDNAVEYTPTNTPIDIMARRSADTVIVNVRDHGAGLPTGTEARVFDKFFRARSGDAGPNRGVGLGLAICRSLIDAHGGTIRAANHPEGGAEFTFTLPIGGTPPVVDASQ